MTHLIIQGKMSAISMTHTIKKYKIIQRCHEIKELNKSHNLWEVAFAPNNLSTKNLIPQKASCLTWQL